MAWNDYYMLLDPIKVICKGFTAYFLINSGETCQTIWNAISNLVNVELESSVISNFKSLFTLY